MCLQTAWWETNSVDPDQFHILWHLIWIFTVCSGLVCPNTYGKSSILAPVYILWYSLDSLIEGISVSMHKLCFVQSYGWDTCKSWGYVKIMG